MTTKAHVTIGVLCMARMTFDHNAASALYRDIHSRLVQIPETTFEFVEELVMEAADACRAADWLARKGVDAVACISGTFHLGHLVLEINKALGKPILLWGLDELPYDGGKIRLNSVCGVNLDASNLYKSGIRNFHVHIGPEIDSDWVDAVRVVAELQRCRIGLAGSRAHGFFNLDVYGPAAYRQLGVLIDHFELGDIWNCGVEAAAVRNRREQIGDIFDLSELNGEQVETVSLLAAKMDRFMEENRLTALALRCWPEFAEGFGIAPCAAMSLLQAEGRIIACEGDVDGAISMIAHRAVGAETPFLFDFSQMNFKEDYALLWHCGVAPCNLRSESTVCSLDTYHAGGKGVTAGFVLKPGHVSILRLDSDGERYRVFLQEADGGPMEKVLRGTFLKVRFANPVRGVLDTLLYNGIAHHASMVYGSFIRPFEIFARIQGIPVIDATAPRRNR